VSEFLIVVLFRQEQFKFNLLNTVGETSSCMSHFKFSPKHVTLVNHVSKAVFQSIYLVNSVCRFNTTECANLYLLTRKGLRINFINFLDNFISSHIGAM
jgi:hypothetical protein